MSTSPDLTSVEKEVLLDIAIGLTEEAVARVRCLSRRGVQNRLASLYGKLGVKRRDQDDPMVRFAPRSRTVFLAMQQGLLSRDEMERHELATRRSAARSLEAG